MSWTPGYSPKEERLLRALLHLMHKNHALDPSGCAGCLEIAGFLAVVGYQGDMEYPTTAEAGT